jgi:demethylmenaquinone methyltransferase / 2-methoxy-6-polyprenyl-1,4-benzoquinol methylase
MKPEGYAAPGLADETRPHRDLPGFYGQREARADFVSHLFDETARYYDRISSLLSFGTCKAYRKRALQHAGLTAPMHLLDVATGTGLMAQAAIALGVSPNQIIGVDPSRGMLQENRKLRMIHLFQGRGESLPFGDESFDFICMGYALRHVEDLGALFREFRRVLKPGGRVLILEITRPDSRVGLNLARIYLEKLLATFVQLITGNRSAGQLLRYYWATIEQCVPPETIMTALGANGLVDVQRRTSHAILTDYLALKPRS